MTRQRVGIGLKSYFNPLVYLLIMKKLTLSLFLILFSLGVYAQERKDSISVDGNTTTIISKEILTDAIGNNYTKTIIVSTSDLKVVESFLRSEWSNTKGKERKHVRGWEIYQEKLRELDTIPKIK